MEFSLDDRLIEGEHSTVGSALEISKIFSILHPSYRLHTKDVAFAVEYKVWRSSLYNSHVVGWGKMQFHPIKISLITKDASHNYESYIPHRTDLNLC